MPNSQYQILTEERYVPQIDTVALSDIVGAMLMPEASFIENVRALGIIQPIVVIAQAGSWKLVAGRRRVTALKEIVPESDWHQSYVPAVIFPADTPLSVAAAMSLSENVQRRPNPLTDLISIEQMLADGATLEDISRQLHLSIGTIRSRMRLARLLPELREALEQGHMTSSTAERACRLDGARQQILVSALLSEGRVTGTDVQRVLRAGANDQIEALPFEMFESGHPLPPRSPVATLPVEGLPTEQGWGGVLQCLQRAEELLPSGTAREDERIVEWIADLLVLVMERINA